MKISLLVALSASLCSASWAQTQPAPIQPAPIQPSTLSQADTNRITDQFAHFKLKNVKPSLMAYWLDPANNPLSLKFGETGYASKTIVPLLGGVFLPGIPQKMPRPEDQRPPSPLPEGIRGIGDFDSSNALVVMGSEEGIKELTPIINLLDQPLRKVELEARFVRLSEDAAEELTPFQSPDGVTRVDSRLNSALEALQKRGSATISVAPPTVVIDNSSTFLYSDSLTRSLLSRPEDGHRPDNRHLGAQLRLLDYSPKYKALVSAWRLEVTPTPSNDHALTLLANFNEEIWNDDVSPDIRKQMQRLRIGGLNVMVNVQDGETIAIKNAKAQSATGYSDASIVLLTAHIVKPAAQ